MIAIDDLVSDFKRVGWKSEPMERALNIAHNSAADAARLAHRCIDDIPKGTTFHESLSRHACLVSDGSNPRCFIAIP